MRIPILLALVALVIESAAFAGVDARDADPPNIILIVADDLGWAELGCYGQTKIRTPNIDRLANEGVRFMQFYSGSPVCAPSRCVLLTGRHPGHAYIRDNKEMGGWGPDEREGQLALPAGTTTIGTLLQDAGYTTACIGKWGLGGPGTSGEPNEQGFDHWFGYLCQRVAHNYYPTHLWRNGDRVPLDGNEWGNLVGDAYAPDLMIDEAIEFVDDHHDEPFFLYYATPVPHLALQVPEDSLREYESTWPDPPYEGSKGYLPHDSPRAAYAAMVTRMDAHVGRLLDRLVDLKVDERTIVLFTSDNGATFDIGGADSPFFESAGPFRGRKGSVFEGGLRVPLVARWPGRIPAGYETDHLAAFWDVLPTFCEIAGVDAPEDSDGLSFLPTLLDNGLQSEHDYLYWEFPGYGSQQAVRIGPWKGVRRNLRRGEERLMLFNLNDDPGESRDVAGEHPDVVERMREILREAHVPSEEFPLWGVDTRAPSDP
ncbi:MAG: arylsulfatase [Phycisphaerales bacterium]